MNPTSSHKNLLVTLADKKYLDFAKQLFASIYFNSGWQGDYMLLAHEVPEEDLKWFRDKGILVRKCDPPTFDTNGPWPNTILGKLEIFTSDFKQWDKVVYLDADLMASGSLDVLSRIDGITAIGNYHSYRRLKLADFFSRLRHDRRRYHDISQRFNLRLPAFASGLLAFDTSIINDDTYDCLISLVQEWQGLDFAADDLAISLHFSQLLKKSSPLYCLDVWHVAKYSGLDPDNIQAIVLNFAGHGRSMASLPRLAKEWHDNLWLADSIDLSNRPIARNYWTQKKIFQQEACLLMRILIYRTKALACGIPKTATDRLAGYAGIFLRSYRPTIFENLINLKYAAAGLLAIRSNESFTIRKFHDGDQFGIRSLFKKVFGYEISLARWQWLYSDYPHEADILVAVDGQDTIVGHQARLSVNGCFQGNDLTMIHPIESCLIGKFRGQNFLHQCHTFNADNAHLPICFFTDTKANVNKYAKVTSRILGRPTPLSTVKIFESVEKLIDCQKNEDFQLVNPHLEDLPDTIDRLWQSKKQEICGLAVSRDWQYVSWKILRSPETIRFFLIVSQGETCGYVAIKTQSTDAFLYDILVLDSFLNPKLIESIKAKCWDLGANRLISVITDKKLERLMAPLPVSRFRNYFVFVDPSDKIRTDNFYLTVSDLTL